MGYKEAGYVAKQLSELGLSHIKLIGNYVYDTDDLLTLAGQNWKAAFLLQTVILTLPGLPRLRRNTKNTAKQRECPSICRD